MVGWWWGNIRRKSRPVVAPEMGRGSSRAHEDSGRARGRGKANLVGVTSVNQPPAASRPTPPLTASPRGPEWTGSFAIA